MRILVFGAGPLGSLLAARLFQGGRHVTLLARSQPLVDLERYGVCLRNFQSGVEEAIRVPLVETFTSADRYDLVIVVMRKNSALKILSQLADNKKVKHYLFLMNNAAGPGRVITSLGAKRVLMGFPGMAGFRQGHRIIYLAAQPDKPANIIIGRNTSISEKEYLAITKTIEKGHYLNVTMEPNMDAWSKYHVALLFPALAPALYLCDNDHLRMSRTRDAIVLTWRGIKEGCRVLRTLGYPVRPLYIKYFLWLPEPVMVVLLARLMRNPRMEVAMARHAAVIRDEIQQLNQEFRELINESGLFTPTIDFLMDQFSQKAPLLPDGSHSMRLRWSELLVPTLLLILLVLVLIYLL